MSSFAIDLLLAAAALPSLGAGVYLGGLALLARRRPPPPAPADARLPRCVLVVPAHDEEAGVAATVASLLALDYPAERCRLQVVADNCSDRTATVAAAAGARVLERRDPQRRGKGYALAFAFEHLLAEGWAELVVVVDADTSVSPNLLRACAARVLAGECAVQARYGVRGAERTWRTRLLRLAFVLFHDLRSLGRERLRLSCGLRGNGMAFTAELLRRVPHEAFSIVEDLEYGLRLGLAGVRVAYADEAQVLGDMAGGEPASRAQRRRWEGGRWRLARREGRTLLVQAWRRRDRLLADLALDLLVPPLGTLGGVLGLGLAACGVAWLLGARVVVASACWGAAALGLALYLARGLQLSGLGWRGLRDLAGAPFYLAWKLALAWRRSGRATDEWVRTSREEPR